MSGSWKGHEETGKIKVVKDQRASRRSLTRLKENVIGGYDTVSDTSHPITCRNMEDRDEI